MLGRGTKIQLSIVLVTILIYIVSLMISVRASEIYSVEIDNVKSISLYYSAGGNGILINMSSEQAQKRNYEYFSSDENVNAYILHYINSFGLIDDGKHKEGGDASSGTVWINYSNGNSERIGFFLKRFVDQNGKQYGLDHNEYRAFWDFIYAVKTGKIILNGDVTIESSEWAETYVDTAVESGLIPVWNRINYKGDITRVEVCQLLSNLLKSEGMPQKETIEYPLDFPFEDTEDIAVSNLYNAGIIDGKSETEFVPYDFVTREELAKMLSLSCEVLGIEHNKTPHVYADQNEISEWAADSVNAMHNLGIMLGKDDNEFKPQDTLTKEELIVAILRISQL